MLLPKIHTWIPEFPLPRTWRFEGREGDVTPMTHHRMKLFLVILTCLTTVKPMDFVGRKYMEQHGKIQNIMVGNVVVGVHIRLLPSSKHVICAPCQSLRYLPIPILFIAYEYQQHQPSGGNDVYQTWSTWDIKFAQGLCQHEISWYNKLFKMWISHMPSYAKSPGRYSRPGEFKKTL